MDCKSSPMMPTLSGHFEKAIPRLLLITLLVTGCSVKSEPISQAEHDAKILEDIKSELFPPTVRPIEPISQQNAIETALRNNLTQLIKKREEALAEGNLELSRWETMPQMDFNWDYTKQSRPSTSDDPLSSTTGSLTLNWNILDFGISYWSAKQKADRVLINRHQRQKATQDLINKTRTAFFRASTTNWLEAELYKLKKQLRTAKKNSNQTLESTRDEKHINDLSAMIAAEKSLQQVQLKAANARVRLNELMGLPSWRTYRLADPDFPRTSLPIKINLIKFKTLSEYFSDSFMVSLEQYALSHRPELWVKNYEQRIKKIETKKALLRLLPGLSFSEGGEYDNDPDNLHSSWAEFGVSLTWDIFKTLFSQRSSVDIAEQEVFLEDLRRLALEKAVMTQARIAYLRLNSTCKTFQSNFNQGALKKMSLDIANAKNEAGDANPGQAALKKAQWLNAHTQCHHSFANLVDASGAFLSTLGIDQTKKRQNIKNDVKSDLNNQEHQSILLALEKVSATGLAEIFCPLTPLSKQLPIYTGLNIPTADFVIEQRPWPPCDDLGLIQSL
jgi:outer membrane protein TolC